MSEHSLLDTILSKTNLIEIINEVTPLTKRGKNHFGLCPFHEEKTPSFSVSEDKGLYHCFSCKASGNALTFLKETKNMTSAQAIKHLADRANITIDSTRFEKPHQKYLNINQEALNFYRLMLNHTKHGEAALTYLNKRKIDETMIDYFDIGLAINDRDALYLALKKQNILASDLVDLGLIKDVETPRDYFRNRIMFPLHDAHGEVIGFSGRVYLDGDETAKYMNTPQTIVFKKGEALYNLHRAKKAIKEKNRVVLFEGFTDLIQAHAAGLQETVALMGTALTDHHIKTLFQLTKIMILCFDGDSAGKTAAQNAIAPLQKAGFTVKIVDITDGLDPDDYLKQHGKVKFLQLIDEALEAKHYLYNQYKQNINIKKLTEVERFKNQVFDMIKPLSNLEQDHYLKRMAEDLDVSYDILSLDFKLLKRKHVPSYKKIPRLEITDKFIKAERHLIRYFLKDRHYEKKFRSEFEDVLFSDKHTRDIQLEIFEYYRLNGLDLCIVPELFKASLSKAQQAYFDAYLLEVDHPYDVDEFDDMLAVMREQRRRYEIKRLQTKIKETDDVKEKITYKKKIDALNKEAKHGQR